MNEPKIIFEDRDILVINKPVGMVVNRADTVKENTLQDWIEKRKDWKRVGDDAKEPSFKVFKARSGVVHRLDKDTSGVLLTAKNTEAFIELQRQFKAREVGKTYVALVHGFLEPDEGSMSLPLARSKFDRQRFAVDARGKESVTGWKVNKRFSKNIKRGVDSGSYRGFTLVEINPETGRTHQIRVHLSHLKHPLVGDVRYAGRKRAREDRKWCPRQFLHAKSLRFIHPARQKEVEFESKLPQDLEKALSYIR